MMDLNADLDLIRQAAVDAGSLAIAEREAGLKIESKVGGSPVTSGDLNGPASLGFGFGTDRDRSRLYFTNYGWPVLGSGTTVASVKVGISGAKLFAP